MLNFIKALFVAIAVILIILLGVVMKINRPAPDAPEGNLVYPETRREDVIDNYHGVEVQDPYRWLEDSDSGEVHGWITAQNNLTKYWIDQIPERSMIRERFERLWDYEKFSTPIKKGGRYFYEHNDGLQNQAVLYWLSSLTDKPHLLLDPNKLSSDGTIALNMYNVSWDGRYLAYGLSDGGSDWRTWRVRNIETGKDLDDHIEWTKFPNVAWAKDSRGFFYQGYEEPSGNELEVATLNAKVMFHVVGESQSQDEVIFDSPANPEWLFTPTVSEDGTTLIIKIDRGTEKKNLVYIKSLMNPNARVEPLVGEFEAAFYYLGNSDDRFWFHTSHNASRGKVVEINASNAEPSNWSDLIPEMPQTIQSVSLVGGRFLISYLDDAKSMIRNYDLGGESRGELELPGLGSVEGFHGSQDDPETFYAFYNFNTPATIYRYNSASNESELYRQPSVDFDPNQFETKQVFYTSKDGTQIPMFISHKRGLQLDGQNPTLLNGYGGFNIARTPAFSISVLVWMEMGGVFAVANLRGGGEYGEGWHQAGTLDRKQNVFDDFIAAGEWLIDNQYTNPEKLAIQGGSNGGLLTGATLLQRPDLFGAAIVQNGVLDMLRYHLFTIGWAWASDYGTSDDPKMFHELFRYSPVHNAFRGREYPATMITTADRDDRVVPAHSYKFASALQRAQSGDEPVLIRIQTRAGHGLGKPTSIILDELSDIWAFLAHQLDMDVSL
jgi:prolyl oligopeptidase